jgi:hypothetical protein
MKGQFSRLEARVEALVEGTFARLFAGRVHPRDVALQLARALEDSAADGTPATHYAVHLNPADADALLQAHPELADALAAELLNLARDAQLTLSEEPRVSLVADPGRKPHTVAVAADGASTAASATQTMSPIRPPAPSDPSQPALRAWLIVDGERTVVLTQAVVNLGRRFDNDIVVDDPRVSRAHAQLRLRFGRYAVYDLGSTAGTFVNGQRVEECLLRPGDVISLGGIPLIYGEDSLAPGQQPARPGAGQTKHLSTRPLEPGSDDRPKPA